MPKPTPEVWSEDSIATAVMEAAADATGEQLAEMFTLLFACECTYVETTGEFLVDGEQE